MIEKKDFLGTAMSDITLNTSVEITQNDFAVSILPPYEGQCLVCEGQGSGQATSVQRRPTSNTAPLKLSSSHVPQLTFQNQWCGFMEDYVFTEDVGNFAHPREESYLAVLYPHLWKILQTASANTQILWCWMQKNWNPTFCTCSPSDDKDLDFTQRFGSTSLCLTTSAR